ncbi:MAG: TlpA disulfide reductase family protein [Bacteroidetes bacterium]|nr:TlpA disulfide reductase family protein [Bacteroidota bacterium]
MNNFLKSLRILIFLLVLVLAGVSFNSCTPRQPGDHSDVVLQVNMSNTLGLSWVFLTELNVKDMKTVDSFDVRKSGRHTFRFKPDGEGFYLLMTRKYNYITLLLAPGERVELVADGKKMRRNYEVKGSPGSSRLREYFYQTGKNQDRLDSLRKAFQEARKSDDFAKRRAEIDSGYYRIFDDERAYVKSFIRRYSGSLASLFVINQRFGPTLVVTENNDYEDFKMLDTVLIKKFPDNKHTLDHHERMAALERGKAEKKLAEEHLKPGNLAPGIRLNDPSGKEVTLSSLIGKQVLLYFWSAQTAVARQEHQAMVPYYKSWKTRKIEILGISLDQNVEMWKAALSVDKLPWINLNESQGMTSSLAKLYAVDGPLPVYYVIDKQGKIAGKGRRFSEVKDLLTVTSPH